MPSSFFKSSAFNGPTPFRYSIGFNNIEASGLIIFVFTNIDLINDCFECCIDQEMLSNYFAVDVNIWLNGGTSFD